MVARNLWPFYKIDARMVCMGDFWYTSTLKESDIQPCDDNNKIASQYFSQLFFVLDTFSQQMVYSYRIQKLMDAQLMGRPQFSALNDWRTTPKTDDLVKLAGILNTDPLKIDGLTAQERITLIKCRHHYCQYGYGLQLFLSAIDWTDPDQVICAHQMLLLWQNVTAEDVLPLLDSCFADQKVWPRPFGWVRGRLFRARGSFPRCRWL